MTAGRRAAVLARDRPYHLAAAALAGGLLSDAGPAGLAPTLAALALLALAAARAPLLGVACAGLVVVGAALAGARLETLDAPGRDFRPGDLVAAPAHLLEPPRRGRFGATVVIRLASGPVRGARLLARAGPGSALPAAATGDELNVRGVVVAPARRTASGFDFAAHLRRRGIAAELRLLRARATGRRRRGVTGALDSLRRRAERGVDAGLDPERAALLRGMVLGQDERISDATRDDWRRSGLAHLLAVSGQNVVLLAVLAGVLLAPLGLAPGVRLAVVLGLIAVYVPLAGAGPSIQRAGVMGAAATLALAASRPASRSYTLLLAAIVTLLLNPRAAGEPGWQLSFAAVAGIVWLGSPLRRVLAGRDPGQAGTNRWLRLALAEALAATVAATLATAPLLVHHFGAAPLASLPANLVALPAVAPVMWLGMAKGALAQLEPLGVPVAETGRLAAAGLGLASRPLLAYLTGVAEHFAALPLPRPAPPLGGAPALAAAYAGLAAAILACRSLARRFGPGRDRLVARWHELPRGRRTLAAAAGAAAAVVLALMTLAPQRPPARLTVSFLDVGQGDATLIQAGTTAVLFDGGPPEANVARLLRQAGVRRLAAVVATHASRDHHGGLRPVLERFDVGLLLDGGDGTRDPAFRALEQAAAERGIHRVRAVAPLALSAGPLRVRILSPRPRGPGPPPEDPNARAVIALVRAGDFELLLSADAESVALAPLRLPDVDAIKVPHHGSADPGLPAVLRRLRPEIATIEVGAGNSYGHPAPSTLAALRRAGIRAYRTDRDGTIELSHRAGRLTVETER